MTAHDPEDVRLMFIEQIKAMPGDFWKAARHSFADREQQGNAFGDHTFGVRLGSSRPLSSARSGMEELQTVIIVRLRFRLKVKDGADARQSWPKETRLVENWLRSRGSKIDSSIRVEWLGSSQPVEVDGAFIDVDTSFSATYWSAVTGVVDGRS